MLRNFFSLLAALIVTATMSIFAGPALAGGNVKPGWDGQIVRCHLLNGKPSIAPSKDAQGVCGPGRSTTGEGDGPRDADA